MAILILFILFSNPKDIIQQAPHLITLYLLVWLGSANCFALLRKLLRFAPQTASLCSANCFALLRTPNFVSGFTDAEGCFHISITRDSKTITGWRVKLIFTIAVHQRDRTLLELIKTSIGAGQIYKHGKDSIVLRVSSVKDLLVIIDHFERYPLITHKVADYILFKRVLELMNRKEHLTLEGLNKVVAIKASMNRGLSSELNKAFPDILPVPRPLIEFTEIKDFNWLAGFIEVKGCFQVVIQESSPKTRPSVSLRFTLTQHSRDAELMKSLVNCLGCGRYYLVSGRDEGYFIVSSFSDISAKIIPFLEKYPLVGSKQQDYFFYILILFGVLVLLLFIGQATGVGIDVSSIALFSIVPVIKYSNADADKLQILLDNKDKSGIYLWRNLINSQKYIGSSVDLRRRLSAATRSLILII
jgi:LAGLIDADG endonuclease